MNRDQFWALIEQSRANLGYGSPEKRHAQQERRMRKLLAALSDKELRSFQTHADKLTDKAYRWDLWHAATVIFGGWVSDDSFMDFRDWLLAMGRDVYERAVAHPESLVTVAGKPGSEETFFEGFGSLASQVYEERTGDEMELALVFRDEPLGKRYAADVLPRRFPLLAAKYWKSADGVTRD